MSSLKVTLTNAHATSTHVIFDSDFDVSISGSFSGLVFFQRSLDSGVSWSNHFSVATGLECHVPCSCVAMYRLSTEYSFVGTVSVVAVSSDRLNEQKLPTNSGGRIKSSHSRLLLETRYMYGSGTSVEMNDKLVGSGTLTADQPRNCYLGSVGTASGDRVVRQTKQYAPYIVGTSNSGNITFTLNQAKTNLRQSVGFFDDLNGFIFRMNGLVPELVIRKNGVDTEVIPQTAWNKERFDGSMSVFNMSGLTADWTKTQIMTVDYEWVGVGRVQIGFNMNSDVHIAHEFFHANILTEPYINQPSLPARWELQNIGTTTSSSTIMMICASMYCEGAESETGFSRSISTDGTSIALTTLNASTDGHGLLAVKLKDVLVGKPNHAFARLKNWSVITTKDIQYKIVILPNSSYLNGTPTWTAVPGYGWCEYIKDFELSSGWQTNNEYNVILDSFALSGGGTGSNVASGASQIYSMDNRSNAIYQNYDSNNSQILAIIGYKLVDDASVRATLNWIEIK